MADIVSDIDKVTTDDVAADAPLSEAFFEKLGANINGLIDRGLKFDQFTANGTWTCPEGVTEVLLIGCGGGGGGGGCGGGGLGGGQGGGGAPLGVRRATVVPTTVYTVTIGAGGAGGVGAANGQDGFPTTFVNFPSLSVQFNGGYGGANYSGGEIKTKGPGAQGGGPSEQGGNSSGFAGGAGGSNSYSTAETTIKIFGLEMFINFAGSGDLNKSFVGGGGGGAGPFGNGAAAAISSNPGQSAAGASGAGGGGASSFGGIGGNGGSGGSGRLLVCYVG
jgi:hypothetical protein